MQNDQLFLYLLTFVILVISAIMVVVMINRKFNSKAKRNEKHAIRFEKKLKEAKSMVGKGVQKLSASDNLVDIHEAIIEAKQGLKFFEIHGIKFSETHSVEELREKIHTISNKRVKRLYNLN